MNIIDGGVTAPKGYLATGLRAGIKPGKTNKDMALIYSEVPATVAGTFTLNMVKAAPVLWDKQIVENEECAQAIVVNSGIANACTGEIGYENTKTMASNVAAKLNIDINKVLVASTGVIGKQLPMDVIYAGIDALVPKLKNDRESAILAAEAILTTDTKKKEIAVEFFIDGTKVTIGAMCKGSGMIHPNMGTMLGFITSDVAISKELLLETIRNDIKDTFNMISVDGDTSTNDSIFLLANGLAGNKLIDKKDEAYDEFVKALNTVTTFLCTQIAGDGEGCTKLIESTVVNAPDKETAKILSKAIITSNLTKCAVYGKDANCGRIICAMGYSGIEFDPNKVDIYVSSSMGKIKLIENGVGLEFDEEMATNILSPEKVVIIADVKNGDSTATAWGCDLTHEYVNINADYRS